MLVVDSDRRGKAAGTPEPNQSVWCREDFFVVDSDGRRAAGTPLNKTNQSDVDETC